MIEKQKLDWDLAQKYVDNLPNQDHTKLVTTEELPHEKKYYTFRFGEAEHDPNRPMGFPVATFRGKDGSLCVSQTRYNHHTLTTANTGSGKTQGVVLNCAFNADPRMSYIFADPKGEIVKASYNRLCELFGKDNVLIANFLEPAHTMVYLNPFTDLGYEWLNSARKKNKKAIRDNIVSELKKVYEILYPVESDKDKSWERTGRSFLLGEGLGLFEDLTLTDEQVQKTGRQRTTPEMINFETLIKVYNSFKWSDRGYSFDDGGFLSTRRKNSLARTYTYSIISNASNTRANYLGFVDLYLARYSDPKILEISRYNNLKASALSESPKVLFLVYDITNEATREYVNICIAKLISDLLEISHKQSAPLHTPVHLVLDEFATLRSSPVYPNLLATGRGSNIFMHMVVQSLEQIHARYPEEWETMLDNCDAQIFLGSNSLNTAKHFAETLGISTVPDSEAFLRGEFRVKQEAVVSMDYLLHRMDHGEAFVRVNNAHPLHTGFELYYKTSEYTAYPSVDPREIKSPFPQIDESRCQYELPKKPKSDEDDLDFLLDEDDTEEAENNIEDTSKEENFEEETGGLRSVVRWTEEPFLYDRSDIAEQEQYAMECTEEIVGIDRDFSRQDVIGLLKILKKLNKIEENNEMLDKLLHKFSIATDKEYDNLKKQIFDEDDE